jgi:hypothetical protein
VLLGNWRHVTDYMIFNIPGRSMGHIYFFISFWVVARLMILNILIAVIVRCAWLMFLKKNKEPTVVNMNLSTKAKSHASKGNIGSGKVDGNYNEYKFSKEPDPKNVLEWDFRNREEIDWDLEEVFEDPVILKNWIWKVMGITKDYFLADLQP